MTLWLLLCLSAGAGPRADAILNAHTNAVSSARAASPFAAQIEEESAQKRAATLAKYNWYQGDLPVCAVYAEMALVSAYTGKQYPKDDILAYFVLKGLYDLSNLGTLPEDVGKAARVEGVTITRTRDPDSALVEGRGLLVIVNPYRTYLAGSPMENFSADLGVTYHVAASHLVWVTAVSAEHVYLNDPGNAKSPTIMDKATFLRAWEEAGSVAWAGPVLPQLDKDGDGYAGFGGPDCDDTDMNARPGAARNQSSLCTVDRDGDGYGAVGIGEGTDCNDDDSTIYPGALDPCYDGVDSDCAKDDDYDADMDGYRSAEYGGDDCDDLHTQTHPGAVELCDGRDNDCDELIDDADPDVRAFRWITIIDEKWACKAPGSDYIREPQERKRFGDFDDLLDEVK